MPIWPHCLPNRCGVRALHDALQIIHLRLGSYLQTTVGITMIFGVGLEAATTPRTSRRIGMHWQRSCCDMICCHALGKGVLTENTKSKTSSWGRLMVVVKVSNPKLTLFCDSAEVLDQCLISALSVSVHVSLFHLVTIISDYFGTLHWCNL